MSEEEIKQNEIWKVGNKLRITTIYAFDEKSDYHTYEGEVIWVSNGYGFKCVYEGKELVYRCQGSYWFGSILYQQIEVIEYAKPEPVKPVGGEEKECDKWCGLNHCDTNGCMNRKRHLVEISPVNPSLQSGVEEAEKECADKRLPKGVDSHFKILLANAFKAGAEWQAQQVKQPVMQWVKASERMPDKQGATNSVIIRCMASNHDRRFVCYGFRTYSEIPSMYFERGGRSFVTVNGEGNSNSTFDINLIEWLEELPIQ